jgi:tyrosyl-tRNA synthetase
MNISLFMVCAALVWIASRTRSRASFCQAFLLRSSSSSSSSPFLRYSIATHRLPSEVRQQQQQHYPFQRTTTRRLLSSSTTTTTATSENEEAIASLDEANANANANAANEADSSDSSIYKQEAEALSKLKSPFLCTMRDRGFLHQCTGISQLDELLMTTKTPQSAYLGFDATADSLHVGSLLQIMILRHLQKSGHRPVVLIGGGTSKVGDPTGKDESRVMLTEEKIQQNTKGISRVFEKFLTFGSKESNNDNANSPTDAVMVNNDFWLSQLKYLDFLRDYGSYFTINRMMSFESVKQRLQREAPFSFLEFNYMILQAYDFLELYRRHGTILQLGGSDQWGNMVCGTELGRKVDGAQLYALTAPLITTADGKKMGKTANGAVWLNADRLSEYDYWQFWRNTADDDVLRFMRLFTELPLDEIEKLEKLNGADINSAKVILADEATALLHGKECLAAIHETVSNMFSGAGSGSTEGLPRVLVSKSDVESGNARLLDLLVNLKLASSKKEARRLIQGGGAKIGDGSDSKLLDDENAALSLDDFDGGTTEVILRAGKKRAGVVELQDK